jgi:uncharacterized protein (DUF1697 family)
MTTYIALFRGINVGRNRSLPMQSLKTILEKLGCRQVKTYIQSGNVVFQHAELDRARFAGQIGVEIEKKHAFRPHVLLLPLEAFEQAIALNPFPEATAEPKTLHVSFLAEEPGNPDLVGLESLKTDSERFALIGRLFYLHAPDGIGRSKLAARIEKALGVPTSDRNWRTVLKIQEMAQAMDHPV